MQRRWRTSGLCTEALWACKAQIATVEGMGGRIVPMASRALVRAAKGPDDCLGVYDRILSHVHKPVIIHWLGEQFDPALAGYWGSSDHNAALSTAIDIGNAHANKIDGIKNALLSNEKEITMRRHLVKGARVDAGDDFNDAELIAGPNAATPTLSSASSSTARHAGYLATVQGLR